MKPDLVCALTITKPDLMNLTRTIAGKLAVVAWIEMQLEPAAIRLFVLVPIL